MISDRELMFAQVAAMLAKATTRIEILLGRMRACPAQEGPALVHDLSLWEGEGWVEEQRALLAVCAQEATMEQPNRPEDNLWLAILEREPALQRLASDDVRRVLRARKFPDALIERYLRERSKLS